MARWVDLARVEMSESEERIRDQVADWKPEREDRARPCHAGELAKGAFEIPQVLEHAEASQRIELAYTIEPNTWQGETRLQLCLKDVRTEVRG